MWDAAPRCGLRPTASTLAVLEILRIKMNDLKNKDQRSITSWNQFIARGLAVVPDLMGAIHKFEIDGHIVEIRIPDIAG